MKSAITFEVTAPTTPAGDKLYLAGTHNGWKVGDPKSAFREVAPGKYELKINLAPGTLLEYKITRGSWVTVEVDVRGFECENRRLAVFGSTGVTIMVPHWKDQAAHSAAPRNRQADVRILGPFPIPALGRDREVAVYLPPNYYHEPNRRFPVLYMWDGQNLFDPELAYNMEWEVDDTCDRLIAEGHLAPMIVVGIYNGNEHRLSELSPWRDARFSANGEGHAFFRWVVSELKDFIDGEFRTLSGPEHTGIAGSSMGGLAALYIALRYPLVFGKVAALSPAFWFARGQIFRYVAARERPMGTKVYLDCGERESARVHPKRNFYKVALSMADLLRQQGFRDGEDLKWVSDPHGTHSEYFWARRLGGALRFLWPGDGKPLNLPRATPVPRETEV